MLDILKRDERIKRHLASEEIPNSVVISWFTASEIALNDDDLQDLIVQGTEPTLMGANLVPFWVIRKTHQGPDLVLQVDALNLEVLTTKSKAYRDIRAIRATAREIITTTYTFNGSMYRAQRSSREKIRD